MFLGEFERRVVFIKIIFTNPGWQTTNHDESTLMKSNATRSMGHLGDRVFFQQRQIIRIVDKDPIIRPASRVIEFSEVYRDINFTFEKAQIALMVIRLDPFQKLSI